MDNSDHFLEMQFETFCTLNKKFYEKEISQDATIEDVKKMLCEETNECNLQSIKMMFNRQILHDNFIISSLNLKEKDFILEIIKSEKWIPKSESQIQEIKQLQFAPIKCHNNLIIIHKNAKYIKIYTNKMPISSFIFSVTCEIEIADFWTIWWHLCFCFWIIAKIFSS